MKNGLLIYGASGFTGKLIAERAKAIGRRVVLAGRDAVKVRRVAESVGLPWRAMSLEVAKNLDQQLADIAVVLNAAGPFQVTARPMAKACLRTGTHYLDIAGELEAFRMLDNYQVEAEKRGVMVMPGVGFTVLASDFLAHYVHMHLQERLREPLWSLRVALSGVDYFSRGTAMTMLHSVREGVLVRRNGALQSVEVGRLERSFDFGPEERICTAANLADPLTAYYTTDAPNIEAYVEASALARATYQLYRELALPMQMWPWNWLLRQQIMALPEGPSDADRAKQRLCVVVEAEDRYRRQQTARLETPDPYTFTAAAALTVAELALMGEVTAGFQTPARRYFHDPHMRQAFEGCALFLNGKKVGAGTPSAAWIS